MQDLCRNTTETNTYYDAMKNGRAPTDAEIEVQMEKLMEEHFYDVNDETINAFNYAKHEWQSIARTMEGVKVNDLVDGVELTAALEAYCFVYAMKSAFRQSMMKVATENAQEIIDNEL